MQFELTIRGGSLEELAHILTRSGDPLEMPPEMTDTQDRVESRAKEVEPELPAKKSRSKKSPATSATDSTTETSSTESKELASGTATAPESPTDGEPVTFEDLRAEASSMMDSGKVDGKAIQEMLQKKFGVKAFGPLTEEQYPAAMEALRDLAA